MPVRRQGFLCVWRKIDVLCLVGAIRVMDGRRRVQKQVFFINGLGLLGFFDVWDIRGEHDV